MTELLTAAQMRAIEQAAIDAGDVTGLELMERAGRGVVEAVFEEWPELAAAPHRAVVLCGPGNNGGDGFVVARLLKEWGWEVEVFLYGDPDKLPPDARVNYERWGELGNVSSLRERDMRRGGFADIYVDALLGTGLKRGLDGELFNVIRHLSGVNGDRYNDRLISIDAPSGLCLDSGRVLHQEPLNLLPGEWLDNLSSEMQSKLTSAGGARALWGHFARLTVCFDSPKPGHFLALGPQLCGKVVVKDIGISKQRCRYNGEPYDDAFELGPKHFRGASRPAFLKLAERSDRVADERRWSLLPLYRLHKFNQHHKYTHGHALIFSGPLGTGGAARLAARGALRVGAGLVSVVCEGSSIAEHAAQLTAVMIKQADGVEDFATLLEDARFNAVCLGPGLGVEWARALVPVALGEGGGPGSGPGLRSDARRRVVLDADALTAYTDAPDVLFAMLHENCVLTPHGGEFRRLFPDIAEKLDAIPVKGPAYSKVDATREAAARAGCTVLFKGPDTVIAHPDGRASINSAHYERAAAWLATAGSGDVLAGFITGLLARGFAPMQAAETAAWLHVECARTFGPGLIAEDLPEQLPAVFRELGVN